MEQSSFQELASKFEFRPNETSIWKRKFLDNAELTFKPKTEKEDTASNREPFYNNIGQLNILKKALGK